MLKRYELYCGFSSYCALPLLSQVAHSEYLGAGITALYVAILLLLIELFVRVFAVFMLVVWPMFQFMIHYKSVTTDKQFIESVESTTLVLTWLIANGEVNGKSAS